MAKTYTATSVEPNHDIDVQVDDSGNITSWIVKGEVDYSNGVDTIRRGGSVDVWPQMNPGEKATLKLAYDKMVQRFNDAFLA